MFGGFKRNTKRKTASGWGLPKKNGMPIPTVAHLCSTNKLNPKQCPLVSRRRSKLQGRTCADCSGLRPPIVLAGRRPSPPGREEQPPTHPPGVRGALSQAFHPHIGGRNMDISHVLQLLDHLAHPQFRPGQWSGGFSAAQCTKRLMDCHTSNGNQGLINPLLIHRGCSPLPDHVGESCPPPQKKKEQGRLRVLRGGH